MVEKVSPFTESQLESVLREFPTPIYIYDERGIRDSARKLNAAFSWVPGGFKNYFAVKATPNPHILDILREEGHGADASNGVELTIAEAARIYKEEIMFTSNNTTIGDFIKAKGRGAIINLDDITYIDFLEKGAGLPELISFRYNPGSALQVDSAVGNAKDAKFGLTKDQIIEAYGIMKAKGINRFGLHTMPATNMLNPNYFIKLAAMLFDLAVEIHRKYGIRFEFIDIGGGFGIPYSLAENEIDHGFVSDGIKKEYTAKIVANGLHPVRIVMECGRFVTGPHGYLVTSVRHVVKKHKNFALVDSNMSSLMRPALYKNAYHHITVVGKEHLPNDSKYDVGGSICEDKDKTAIDRQLPRIEDGDKLVVFDVGAHCHALTTNYNSNLRPPELLLKSNGTFELIRRAETPQDYFATLSHPNLRSVIGSG